MAVDTGGWTADLRSLIGSASAAVEGAINEDRIRLAVTGLSRAGKTVFITSLIHNLLALGRGRNTLPRLTARLTSEGTNRLVSVKVLPAGAAVLPAFDYDAKLAGLAAAHPSWPERTEDLAQISLSLELRRKSAVGQRLGNRRVRLDILDYPGEWLLDLPLLGQSFADWSTQALDLLHRPPRSTVCEPFLSFVANLRASDRAEESMARQGHALYRQALDACRKRYGLRYLQPGRFLCPGLRSDAPFLWFFPLQMRGATPAPGTLGALLRDRFEAYKEDMRASFFDTHFAAFDRQVMLVDVLGALAAGRGAFEDTARAIHHIAQALRYGSNLQGIGASIAADVLRGAKYVLPWMPYAASRAGDAAAAQLGRRCIHRVVFVAAKADHVPAMKRDNLRNLLRALADPAETRQSGAGVSVTYQVAAALLSTEDGSAKLGDRSVEVVRGIPLGEEKVRAFYVGDVPSSLPPDSFWSERYFEMPTFRPPRLDPTGQAGLPHLGLDQILDDLLGELL